MCNEGNEECKCDHPDISKGKSEDCTLNQVIKCHGDKPFREILKWMKDEE